METSLALVLSFRKGCPKWLTYDLPKSVWATILVVRSPNSSPALILGNRPVTTQSFKKETVHLTGQETTMYIYMYFNFNLGRITVCESEHTRGNKEHISILMQCKISTSIFYHTAQVLLFQVYVRVRYTQVWRSVLLVHIIILMFSISDIRHNHRSPHPATADNVL